MKLLITNDLHQCLPKWEQLVRCVEDEHPAFVLVAGDLLPNEGLGAQAKFFPVLETHFERMKSAGALPIVMLGNDDWHVLESRLDRLAANQLCVNINRRVFRDRGLAFCGVNVVRDFPFRYKHYCVPDGDFCVCPVQFGTGFDLDASGQRSNIPDLDRYLRAKPELLDELNALKNQLTPEEVHRSVWLVHNPPATLGMDICADGNAVGSPTIYRFIAESQPLLGCSGHIHESPYQRGGKWIGLVGDCLWFQPGQMGERLHVVSLELTERFNIRNIRHSVFGPTTIEFDRFV